MKRFAQLGPPNDIPMLVLADTAVAASCGTSTLCVKPLPHNDMLQRGPSATLTRRLTGWKPRAPLAAGMHATAHDFREKIKSTKGASQ